MAAPMPKSRMAGKSAPSSTPAQVRERKVGDFFEYQIEHPVTIRRNQSALVPIVLRSFEGKPVLLFNAAGDLKSPMRCVEFKNTTGLTLEGGPLVVSEAGSYVGEAMLETTKPDEKRLIPYAVELSVRVLDNVRSSREQVHKIVIRNGTLVASSHQVETRTYHFDNTSSTAYELVLEHPRPFGWSLDDSLQPDETTENFWRFRLTLAPNRVSDFVVKQRSLQQQRFGLGELRDDQIRFWIDQKFLDKKTEKTIRDIAKIQQEAVAADSALKRIEAERAAIHEEQGRIRENLQSLGDRPAEKELRERYVRTLNAHEDRLEQIRRDIATKTDDRDQCRRKVDALLGDLEWEKAV
jgi:hypothetical protein